MKAMVLRRIGPVADGPGPLELAEWPEPQAAAGEVRLRVRACGVCHTELDEIEGRAPPARLPRIPGHQVVGVVDQAGDGVAPSWIGARVGVAWIGGACGTCAMCRGGRENLCPSFVATGRDVDGGYAELMAARAAFVYPIPPALADAEAAPLLCAGAIGLRSLSLTRLRDGEALGLTGFGASGHLVLAMARRRFPRSPVFVFARSAEERAFARELGAAWTGDTAEIPPRELDAVIDTTPVWTPIVRALERLAPGGRLVVNAIRKEDVDKRALLDLDWPAHLWREKSVTSVANVTRADVAGCLELAATSGLRPAVTAYSLEDANTALRELKRGGIRGAKVILPGAWL
jgi:propanol-preferring alcohol dehydrogenase